MAFLRLVSWLLLLVAFWPCKCSNLSDKEMRALKKVMRTFYGELFWSILISGRKESLCAWPEVTCVRVQGVWRVSKISAKVAIIGTLSEEIGQLRWLQELDLGLDKPSSTGVCLTGNLPKSMGQLLQLRKLNLANHKLVGPIPESFFQLRQLQVLDLAGNKLTGPLRDDFGSLTQLQILRLQNNGFTGSLPKSFGRLLRLKEVNVSSNELSGSLGAELGRLSELSVLSLANNAFSGPVPETLGNLVELTALELHGNELEGSIPDTFGQLTALKTLNAGHLNIPFTLRRLTQLEHFSWKDKTNCAPVVSDNCHLFGDHDGCKKEEGELVAKIMKSLWGSNYDSFSRRIEGCHCFWYGVSCVKENAILTVWGLNIQDEGLTGTLPEEIGALTNLQEVRLQGNLQGELPASISQLKHLRYLDLEGNQLSGELPPKWSEKPKRSGLQILKLSRNSFEGHLEEFPLNLFPQLEVFELALNRMEGRSWSTTHRLNAKLPLRVLDLRSNFELWGRISPNFGLLQNLQRLYLSSNQFDGVIPPEMGNLTELQELNLESNLFQAPSWPLPVLPDTFMQLTSLWNLRLGSNSFDNGFNSEGNCAPLDEDPCAIWGRSDRVKLDAFLQTLWTAPLWKSRRYTSSSPLCTWSGVECEYLDGAWRVTSLSIEDPFVSGYVASTISDLMYLKEIRIQSARLTGNLPRALLTKRDLEVLAIEGGRDLRGSVAASKLSSTLRELVLIGNFTGNFFLQFLKDTSLRTVMLRSPDWSIVFPSASWEMPNLASLDLRSCKIEQNLQDILPALPLALRTLDLSDTKLAGKFPSYVSHLQGLRTLKLSDNKINLQLPESFGALTQLQTIDLSNGYMGKLKVPKTLRSLRTEVVNVFDKKYPDSTRRNCAPLWDDPCHLMERPSHWTGISKETMMSMVCVSFLVMLTMYGDSTAPPADVRVPPGALELAVEFQVASVDLHRLVATATVLASLLPATVVWWWRSYPFFGWSAFVWMVKNSASANNAKKAQGQDVFSGLNFWFPRGASVVTERSGSGELSNHNKLLAVVLLYTAWDFWYYEVHRQWAAAAADTSFGTWLLADPWGGATLLKMSLVALCFLHVVTQVLRSRFGRSPRPGEQTAEQRAVQHLSGAYAIAASTSQNKWRDIPQRNIEINWAVPFSPDTAASGTSVDVEMQDAASFAPRSSSSSRGDRRKTPVIGIDIDTEDPKVLEALKLLTEKLEQGEQAKASGDGAQSTLASRVCAKLNEAEKAAGFCTSDAAETELLVAAMEDVEQMTLQEDPTFASAVAVLASAMLEQAAAKAAKEAAEAATKEAAKVPEPRAKTLQKVRVQTNCQEHEMFPYTIPLHLQVTWFSDFRRSDVSYKVWALEWNHWMALEIILVVMIGLSCLWLSYILLWLDDFFLASIVFSGCWRLFWPRTWILMRYKIQASLKQGYWEDSLALLRSRASGSVSLMYLLVCVSRFPALATSCGRYIFPGVCGILICTFALARQLCLRDRIDGYRFDSVQRSPDAIRRYRDGCFEGWMGILGQLIIFAYGMAWLFGWLPRR